jgi:shikimate kinase
MRIFLVGFMGCGKTTLGSRLANKLKYQFMDLDKVLEASAGMPIAEYFKKFGEERFREFERDILQSTTYPDNVIVSTGGGAPCFFDNMDWMNRNGTTIYISMLPKALAVRLKSGKNERPLIKDLSEEQLIDFIHSRLAERNVFYNKAHHIISGIDITPERVIEAVDAQLK